MKQLGLYIHIPFCRSKCDYCDFYSLAGREERMDDYQRALLAHIAETAPRTRGYQVDTVYFGGGTPSFYGEKRLRALLSAIKKYFSLAPDGEITLECNPDSVDKRMLTHLRRAGVNRVSLGVQSACDAQLVNLHRPHTFEQAVAAVGFARKAKIKNLSLDLIYGLPGQTAESWKDTVESVLALEPEHLSCYGLKVEENTPLARRVQEGETLPDDDAQADMYLWTVERLKAAGYGQYEISNFSRKGCQSRHNLRYWLMREYIGFGPGAHSDFGGRRYAFVRDLDDYVNGVLHGGKLLDQNDLIPTRERSAEYLMLGLRTVRGIEEWEYRRTYFMNFDPIQTRLELFESHGWAEQREGRWRLTPRGFLLSNRLIGELLELQEAATLETTLPRVREQKKLRDIIPL